ncbi:hypothetical protein Mtc_0981 [Methanocella conradii HZ254]|uniref:RecA-superfamily ATPases implicated in signal transduction n=1 Tax=Methanocella conradii (strain DSM 24694 / JCM 17849 / CGMCC 1.5162 / HZ254) TaxID=1041930 RepID=H8I5R9_METCZ|nr:hypothetical protein [Methanocella conradii]AFC99736.1 hypothetical protein Mtc_0981 [Methanocella conradii HZ254]MDI6896548.1 hypothetical protein [Methanocella conradii]
MDKVQKGFPSGIKSFDAILKDNVLQNSVILLMNEVGAGARSWMYTSLAGLSHMKAEQSAKKTNQRLPDKILYISLSRSKEEVLGEISDLKIANIAELEKMLVFIDLSYRYFSSSNVPRSWIQGNEAGGVDVPPFTESSSLMDELVKILDAHARNSIVVIDSMNDLIRLQPEGKEEWTRLIILMKGISRMAMIRNNNVYVFLTMSILEKNREEDIADNSNSVLVFKWDSSSMSQPRSIMQIKKFKGILPIRSEGLMLTLETKLSPERGFEVSYTKEILGK